MAELPNEPKLFTAPYAYEDRVVRIEDLPFVLLLHGVSINIDHIDPREKNILSTGRRLHPR